MKGITRSFKSLFEEQVDVSDNETQNSFGQHWGWYQSISVLSEDRVTEIDRVTSLPLISCLNHLSYLMDLNKEKERIMKQQK